MLPPNLCFLPVFAEPAGPRGQQSVPPSGGWTPWTPSPAWQPPRAALVVDGVPLALALAQVQVQALAPDAEKTKRV
jgi:hypothetical protein